MKKGDDRYLRLINDIPDPPPGLSKIDYARIRPGPNLSRGREVGVREKQKEYKRDPEQLLCRGCAVGLCQDGLVRHLWPWYIPQQFVGFVLSNLDNNKVLIMSRGAVFLTVPYCRIEDRARVVYAVNCNEFTLDEANALCNIGKIRFMQPDRSGWASVAFKAFDDPDPLELFSH